MVYQPKITRFTIATKSLGEEVPIPSKRAKRDHAVTTKLVLNAQPLKGNPKIAFTDNLLCDEHLDNLDDDDLDEKLPRPPCITKEDIEKLVVDATFKYTTEVAGHKFRTIMEKKNACGGITHLVVSRHPLNPSKYAVLKVLKLKNNKDTRDLANIAYIAYREAHFGAMFRDLPTFSGVLGYGQLKDSFQFILSSELVTYSQDSESTRPAQNLRTAFGGEMSKDGYHLGPFIPVSRKKYFKTIAKQLLGILETLSAKRVCHRDIRPENLLLQYTPDFSDVCMVAIDFGTAISLDKTSIVYNDRIVYGKYTTMPIQALMIHSGLSTKGIRSNSQHFRECSDAWGAGMVLAALFGAEEIQTVTKVQSTIYTDLIGREKMTGYSGHVYYSNVDAVVRRSGDLVDDLCTWMEGRRSDVIYPDCLVTDWTKNLDIEPAQRNLINALLLCSNRKPTPDDKECLSPTTKGFWDRMYALLDAC